MTDHPITPPPELVGEWLCDDGYPWDPSEQVTITITTNRLRNVATQAARWGSDQELEACGAYLERCAQWEPEDIDELRAARRPKPPSLKEQALAALPKRLDNGFMTTVNDEELDTIRLALEALPDD
jgi:hypothetical protein